MRIKINFLFIGLITILVQPVKAQLYSNHEIQLAEQLQSLANNSPSELAYIQTSKDIYEAGEDLWFKVYILSAKDLVPSDLSKTLYLQLLNESTRRVVWEEKYEIQSGISNGRVFLSQSLEEGNYFLVAFTPESFFNDSLEQKAVRRIRILKNISSLQTEQDTTGTPLSLGKSLLQSKSVQFNVFPEGGNMVAGINGKVAFKAVTSNGEPLDIKGILYENSIPLIEFKSTYAGMGSFDFIPETGKKYVIRLTEPAIDSTYYLPDIAVKGMSMRLTERNKDYLSFKISQEKGSPETDFIVRVQCRGVVYGMTSGTIDGKTIVKIPLSDLPQGIAEVTLFNADLIPVAERLVYVNIDRKLNISTFLTKEVFPTRGKAILKIKVTDESGMPVTANLGVSVFDKLYQNTNDSNNIISHIYLASQLKGKIYNPSYYFNSVNKNRQEAMDLLLLTQGWRRYVWNQNNLNKSKKKQLIYDGIKGNVFYSMSKRWNLKEQKFVMAFSPNKDSVKIIIPADSLGEFTIPEKFLREWQGDYVYMKPFARFGSKQIFKPPAMAMPDYDLKIRITEPFTKINDAMKGKIIEYPGSNFSRVSGPVAPQLHINGAIEIPEVQIKGQKGIILRGKYMGSLDSVYLLSDVGDYVCKYGVLNCPRHHRDEEGCTIPVEGHWYAKIVAYNTPGEIAVPIVYQRPKMTEEKLLKFNNLSREKAYFGYREFYKPNYDQVREKITIPDFRNTLLWEPLVLTDSSGEATLSFFCSDINTDFVGRIEGVGKDGLLGYGSFNFLVRKVKSEP